MNVAMVLRSQWVVWNSGGIVSQNQPRPNCHCGQIESNFSSTSPAGQKLAVKQSSIGAFTLVTSQLLKSQYFDPTIYTCAKNAKFLLDFWVGNAHTCASTSHFRFPVGCLPCV